MSHYRYQRGETITLALDAVEGDIAIVTAVTAKLKLAAPGRKLPPASDPAAATLIVTNRAVAGTIPAGWNLTIPANVSSALAAGFYYVDAALELVGGAIDKTEAVLVEIAESIT